jgi:hypothetical protein
MLVVDEPVSPAEMIVVSLDSGGAGALEAADLVHGGVAKQVAVFADPPSGDDHEFIRRGLPYDDVAARRLHQLALLGVTSSDRIPKDSSGTEGEVRALLPWCEEHRFKAVIMVTSADHSRRTRRLLDRATKDHPTTVIVRPSRYSPFDPDRWWETRDGVRTFVVEIQKLAFDVLIHPVN